MPPGDDTQMVRSAARRARVGLRNGRVATLGGWARSARHGRDTCYVELTDTRARVRLPQAEVAARCGSADTRDTQVCSDCSHSGRRALCPRSGPMPWAYPEVIR